MLTAISVYPVALLAAVLVAWRGEARDLPAGQVAARVLLVLYLAWIVGATLFPVPLQDDGGRGLSGALNHPNLVPLASIRETLALPGLWPRLRLLGGNVLVFVPLGLLLPIVWPRGRRVSRMVLAALLFSLSIEIGQLAVSLLLGFWYRMSDVDDVLLNVVGVLLGWGLYRLLAARAR